MSNDELIEILSKGSKLNEIEPHLGKCFEGFIKFYMGDSDKNTENSNIIHGMISPEKEVIPFNKII